MPRKQVIADSISIEEQTKKFLNENPTLKRSLKIFNISDKEYINALEAQNQKEQLIYTNSTGEAESGYIRANSK